MRRIGDREGFLERRVAVDDGKMIADKAKLTSKGQEEEVEERTGQAPHEEDENGADGPKKGRRKEQDSEDQKGRQAGDKS
jgi:hypothetical protein